jgi:hypothetical protein
MADEGAGVSIVAADGRTADDQPEPLALVEILDRLGLRYAAGQKYAKRRRERTA